MGNSDCIDKVILVIELFNNDTSEHSIKPACFMID